MERKRELKKETVVNELEALNGYCEFRDFYTEQTARCMKVAIRMLSEMDEDKFEEIYRDMYWEDMKKKYGNGWGRVENGVVVRIN
jgi:hypothetical protein